MDSNSNRSTVVIFVLKNLFFDNKPVLWVLTAMWNGLCTDSLKCAGNLTRLDASASAPRSFVAWLVKIVSFFLFFSSLTNG